MSVAVVYVHGLWLQGHEAVLLRRRLAAALRAQTHSFTYRSVSANVTDNALALGRYLQAIRTDTLHLVAHSLGGVVTLKLFELWQAQSLTVPNPAAALPPGRIVLLGSPVRGSRSAQRLVRLPGGNRLLGATGAAELLGPRDRRWQGPREVGVIAGDLPLGLGRLLGPMGGANDGTVLLSETDLPGASAQLRLRVSHSGLPYSAAVAAQTATFLRDGRFAP